MDYLVGFGVITRFLKNGKERQKRNLSEIGLQKTVSGRCKFTDLEE